MTWKELAIDILRQPDKFLEEEAAVYDGQKVWAPRLACCIQCQGIEGDRVALSLFEFASRRKQGKHNDKGLSA